MARLNGANTAGTVTISLRADDYSPLGCTRCTQRFANYVAWADRMNHGCVCFTEAQPVNVASPPMRQIEEE